METIFHEKQDGYLCAQHCLNALLQGPYFNVLDLANLGHQMDEEERIRMAESGIDSEDYRHFLEQPSGNMDDSGYFSVQVISSALKVWGLELIPYNSTEPTALLAQKDPSQMKAYICNYKGHWFTIRKTGKQWFNLNSMLNGPQLISDTYLAMYLTQLMQEGYAIFIVIGSFPQCVADNFLSKNPVVVSPKSENTKAEDEALKAALALGEIQIPWSVDSVDTDPISKNMVSTSRSTSTPSNPSKSIVEVSKPRERIIPIKVEGRDDDDDGDEELRRAVQLSLEETKKVNSDKNFKLRLDIDDADKVYDTVNLTEDTDEEDDLRRALQLSLECVTAPSTPDPEDVRWRRLNHFDMYTRPTKSETSQKLNI